MTHCELPQDPNKWKEEPKWLDTAQTVATWLEELCENTETMLPSGLRVSDVASEILASLEHGQIFFQVTEKAKSPLEARSRYIRLPPKTLKQSYPDDYESLYISPEDRIHAATYYFSQWLTCVTFVARPDLSLEQLKTEEALQMLDDLHELHVTTPSHDERFHAYEENPEQQKSEMSEFVEKHVKQEHMHLLGTNQHPCPIDYGRANADDPGYSPKTQFFGKFPSDRLI